MHIYHVYDGRSLRMYYFLHKPLKDVALASGTSTSKLTSSQILRIEQRLMLGKKQLYIFLSIFKLEVIGFNFFFQYFVLLKKLFEFNFLLNIYESNDANGQPKVV